MTSAAPEAESEGQGTENPMGVAPWKVAPVGNWACARWSNRGRGGNVMRIRAWTASLFCALMALVAPTNAGAATNGQLVAVGAPHGNTQPTLRTLNLNGGGLRTIWTGPPYTRIRNPKWSPDGNFIAFVLIDAEHGYRVMRYDGHTGAVNPVTDHPATWTTPLGDAGINDDDPTWSQDGARIAFVHTPYFSSPNHNSWSEAILTRRPDGTDEQVIMPALNADDFLDGLAWSPDGARIAFHGHTDNSLETVGPSGTGRTTLVPSGVLGEPAWSPNSSRIAFVAPPFGSPPLGVVSAAGGTPAALTTGRRQRPLAQLGTGWVLSRL